MYCVPVGHVSPCAPRAGFSKPAMTFRPTFRPSFVPVRAGSCNAAACTDLILNYHQNACEQPHVDTPSRTDLTISQVPSLTKAAKDGSITCKSSNMGEYCYVPSTRNYFGFYPGQSYPWIKMGPSPEPYWEANPCSDPYASQCTEVCSNTLATSSRLQSSVGDFLVPAGDELY